MEQKVSGVEGFLAEFRPTVPAQSAGFTGTSGSGDLFDGKPIPRRAPARRRSLAPELTAARVLCRQLTRKQALPEKQRLAHLICLNLRAILNRPRTACSPGVRGRSLAKLTPAATVPVPPPKA